MIGRPDRASPDGLVDYKTSPPVKVAPRPEADYKLLAGENPRQILGPEWRLVDYAWGEKSGIARMTYRLKWDRSQRRIVEVQQPADRTQAGWKQRPKLTNEQHAAMLARHFEAFHVTSEKLAIGAYGR